MNYFGVYHAEVRGRMLGICDAPHISKGRMTLSGFETASSARCMAMVHGRLRNRAKLARELDCPPYVSQAKIVLEAYARWGDGCVERLEGACMCCIADVDRDRMLIIRDRMGETSVFYACRSDGMVFADHPDMILKSAFVEPAVGREELCEIFGMGPARTPGKTLLKGIKSLEPGCMLICEGTDVREKRYYELKTHEHCDNEKKTVEKVRALLEEAVSDVVPLHPACMLSGGVDSTALTALLSTRIGRLESFSVDYRDNDQDFVANSFRPEKDAPYIQLAARTFGTRHRNIILEQEDLADALIRATRARGFPGMADIDSSLLLFAREIVRFAPSVVSGECGDEVFGGYPWFRDEAETSMERFPWSGSMDLRENILRSVVREKLQIRSYVSEAMHNSMEKYDLDCINDPAEKKLFCLQRLCFDYFMSNLQERAVRMCEIHGLLVLTPLCDNRLVEYVYNVPWRIKRMNGIEKGLLRESVLDLLPEKLCMRKKSPYPKTCSAAYTSIIKGKMRELCADREAPLWRIVDPDALERMAAGQLDPAETPWYGQLMAGPQMLAYLLQVNAWLKERNVKIELE